MKKTVCFVLLAVLTQGLLSQESQSVDVRLFRTINNAQSSSDAFFEYLDRTTIPTFAAIPAGFLILGGVNNDRKTFDEGVLLGTAQAFSLGTTMALKALVDRPRPYQALDEVKVKHEWSGGGASFPSGHSSQAFAIATTLSLMHPHPEVYVPLILWAGLVSYGRVYLGLHYPSDVLGGAVLGAGSAFLMWTFRDDILRLTDRILGREAVSSRVTIIALSGMKLLQVQIRLN